MFTENLKAPLEAILFASGNPVRMEQIADILCVDTESVKELLEELQDDLDARGSGLTIRRVAGGCQMVTRPEVFPYVERLTQAEDQKLSAPTMETLSIIAFRQPITKQEIEHIRGVRVEHALRKLLDLELVHEAGRKAVIGRPILYATTDTFLRVFGLNSLEDLPELPALEDPEVLSAEQLDLPENAGVLIGGDEEAEEDRADTQEDDDGGTELG